MFFNAVFGNLYDQRAALLHCVLSLVKPGGFVVISHPEGRAWHSTLHAQVRRAKQCGNTAYLVMNECTENGRKRWDEHDNYVEKIKGKPRHMTHTP